jgi:antibiotic biosynthesis monooxygenase (ABM) superfamily enzyme
MSLDDTFSENAPTVGPQIRTLRLVEHVKPEQEQAYLEWSREFSDAHANFINERDPESWSSVVMIRDRAFGRNDVRYIKVFRFPDDAIFEAWTASDERREMIRKGQALNFAVDENALERAVAASFFVVPSPRESHRWRRVAARVASTAPRC